MTQQANRNEKKSWPLCILAVGLLSAVMALAAYNNAYNVSDDILIDSYVQKFDITRNYSGEPLIIDAVPDQNVNLEITVRQSIKGYWSSEGITINIYGSDQGSDIVELITVQEKDWDDDINFTILEKNDPIKIPITFKLPGDVFSGTQLSGSLTGEITFPYKGSGKTQDDKMESLDIPLAVRVISGDEMAETVRDIAMRSLLIFGLLAVVGITIPAIYFSKNRKKRALQKKKK